MSFHRFPVEDDIEPSLQDAVDDANQARSSKAACIMCKFRKKSCKHGPAGSAEPCTNCTNSQLTHFCCTYSFKDYGWDAVKDGLADSFSCQSMDGAMTLLDLVMEATADPASPPVRIYMHSSKLPILHIWLRPVYDAMMSAGGGAIGPFLKQRIFNGDLIDEKWPDLLPAPVMPAFLAAPLQPPDVPLAVHALSMMDKLDADIFGIEYRSSSETLDNNGAALIGSFIVLMLSRAIHRDAYAWFERELQYRNALSDNTVTLLRDHVFALRRRVQAVAASPSARGTPPDTLVQLCKRLYLICCLHENWPMKHSTEVASGPTLDAFGFDTWLES